MNNEDLAGMFTSSTTTVAPTTIHDVHIEVLKAIDNELNRLHTTLAKQNNGDDDVTQEQITTLIDELVRLSEQLGDAEVENEASNG
jgi:cob(I)alamin adenosyltransferase